MGEETCRRRSIATAVLCSALPFLANTSVSADTGTPPVGCPHRAGQTAAHGSGQLRQPGGADHGVVHRARQRLKLQKAENGRAAEAGTRRRRRSNRSAPARARPCDGEGARRREAGRRLHARDAEGRARADAAGVRQRARSPRAARFGDGREPHRRALQGQRSLPGRGAAQHDAARDPPEPAAPARRARVPLRRRRAHPARSGRAHRRRLRDAHAAEAIEAGIIAMRTPQRLNSRRRHRRRLHHPGAGRSGRRGPPPRPRPRLQAQAAVTPLPNNADGSLKFAVIGDNGTGDQASSTSSPADGRRSRALQVRASS